MLTIGLLREEEKSAEKRVALTPSQCRLLRQNLGIRIIVQSSNNRCFSDEDYRNSGTEVKGDIRECDIFLGIKEVQEDLLIPQKTYLFFSHTKKLQVHNQRLFRAILEKKITLIDYECMEHNDGRRILGFGFIAGIVGAHNGIMSYGKRSELFDLKRIHEYSDHRDLMHTYFALKLPNVKIAVTGSGRVAHGVLEVLNAIGIREVEPDEYLNRTFDYPVYAQLKNSDIYVPKNSNAYEREDFHNNPNSYQSCFLPYTKCTNILMNGLYWHTDIPRLFELDDINAAFSIQTIADISDDERGSVPINIGRQTIDNPTYGVDKISKQKTLPYLPGSIDIMAVGNLPNELPRDASRCFGEQLIKHVLNDLIKGESPIIENATIVKSGIITKPYTYMEKYGGDIQLEAHC